MFLAAILFAAAALMVLERCFPDQTLPRVQGWWQRVVALNTVQLALIVLAGFTWDLYLQRVSIFQLPPSCSAPLQGMIGYLLTTFVFYWWHRLRHDSDLCWNLFHQIHHSPQRIETITSFFKHPLEILVNSIIVSFIAYTLLGLDIIAAGWVTLYTALAELFYHMNIRTPRWIGLFIQRPEMHRIHHKRGKHYMNFADLPLWDMLFGTYENPQTSSAVCGFKPEREQRIWDMICFRNVNGSRASQDNP